MRASPWTILRAASSPCRFCHCSLGQSSPSLHNFHTYPSRRREDNTTDPSSCQSVEEIHNGPRYEEAPSEVEDVADEGPEKPPRPKDKSNYGSAARRSGRNIKRPKELPPVNIPPWFLSRNVKLQQIDRGIRDFSPRDQKGAISSSHIKSSAQPERAPAVIPETESEGQTSGDTSPQDSARKPASDAAGGPGFKDAYREIDILTRAGLQVPSIQRAEVAVSQKPHIMLFCPKDGASTYLELMTAFLAKKHRTDYLRLSPQDIAEVGGDYLDEPTEFRSNTISSLGYDAPLLSTSRHAPPPEDPPEEEEYDDPEDEDIDHGGFRPIPFQRAGSVAFGGAAIHVGAFGGSIQDVFKSLMPSGGSSQSPKPIVMEQPHQQPKDMTPELKMTLLVETLLNAPEIKRGAASASKVKDTAPDAAAQSASEDGTIESASAQEDNCSTVEPHSESEPHGLIILISDYPQVSNTMNGSKFLNKLHEVVDGRRKEGQKVLIIGTAGSKDLMPSISGHGVREVQNQPRTGPMRTIVTPVKELPQSKSLQEEHGARIKEINTRHLRDMLRRIAPDSAQVAQVVSDWSLDLDSKTTFLSGLHESVWSMDRINRVATIALGSLENTEELTIKHLERALELIDSSDNIKIDWARDEREQRKKKHAAAPGIDPEESSKERLRKLRKTCNDHEKKLLNGVVNPEDIRTTFADVQASPATIDALKTLTSLSLVRPDAFTYGVLATDRIPGLLLYGPPGTGKTLLARAVAKESGATVLEVSGSDVYDMYVGEGEKNVRAIFSLAKKLTPCIIFIDEADAILGARSGGSNRASHRELINQFLREWDGMTETSAFIMVATNRPFDLDEASLRRLPRRLLVDLPVEKDREAILKIHLKDELLSPDVSLSNLASQTPFYSGSDLKNVAVAAALACVREEFDTAAAASQAKEDPSSTTADKYTYPEKRTLHPHHFSKAMEEISASISEDMGSLSAIRKFDEKYGDRRGRRKKGGYGFKTVTESEGAGSDAARVRNQS